MKTLKVLLQEVVSGIKAWVNSNFAQESNTVHKTGNETVNGVKTFSSANILSEVNRVDKGLWFNGQREAYIFPENAASYSGLLFTTESYGQSFKFGDSTTSNDEVSFNYNNAYLSIYAGYYSSDGKNKIEISPRNADESSLGTSTYQWNNVCAKKYFYNGTAWGLDKANVWTGSNKFTDLTVSSVNTIDITQSTLSSATIPANLPFKDNNGRYWGAIRTQVQTDRGNILKFTVSNWKTNGTQGTSDLCFYYDANLDKKSFYPTGVNVDLGTPTNKWRSFNGVNPGALSLPDYNNYLDVTSSIPVASLDGTTQINLNDYLADKTGWLSIVIDDTAGNSILVTQGKAGGSTVYNNSRTFHTGAQSNGYISVFFPMIAGLSQKAFIKASSLIQMRFYYCLGNV